MHQATVSGNLPLTVRSVMFKNPGSFTKVALQIFDEFFEYPEQPCGDIHGIGCIGPFPVPRTLANCNSTGGVWTSATLGGVCTWVDSTVIDTTRFPYNGWQELRVRAVVEQVDSQQSRTSTGIRFKLVNPDKPVQDYPYAQWASRSLENRGWYTGVNYSTTFLWDPPMIPVAGIWRPWVEMQEGSEGLPTTSHLAVLNAAFHNGDSGTLLRSGQGAYSGPLEINTASLPDGWNKLHLQAKAFDQALVQPAGSTNAASGTYYFETQNTRQPGCGVPWRTHSKADVHVRDGTYAANNFDAETTVEVKNASSSYNRIAFLQFDLQYLAASQVGSATLMLFVQSTDVMAAGTSFAVTVRAAPDTWAEDSITWNNRPTSLGPVVATFSVTDTSAGSWIAVDLTAAVNSQLAAGGDKVVSVAMADESSPPASKRVAFASEWRQNSTYILFNPSPLDCVAV